MGTKIKNFFLKLINKFSNWLSSLGPTKYATFCAGIVFCIFIIAYIGTAIVMRHQLINQFDKGVEYYEAGDYETALTYFDDLVNWKIGKRDGQEMYRATLQQLREESTIYFCPWCGHTINIKDFQ